MKFYIASDHAGFELKGHLVKYLMDNAFKVEDKGPFEYEKTDDYPDWIALATEEVSKDPVGARAIVIGYSGQGEAIAANKFKNVRAGVYYGGKFEIPKLLREHNDANVLALGAGFISLKEAEQAVDVWIETGFSKDERHVRRIHKIAELEQAQ